MQDVMTRRFLPTGIQLYCAVDNDYVMVTAITPIDPPLPFEHKFIQCDCSV